MASVSLTVGQQVTGTGSGGGTGGTGGGGDSSADSAASSADSSSSSSGQIVVIGTDSYIVNTTVDDTEIGQIATGDQVDITPTGSTTPVYGTVGSISLIGSQSSDVTTFPVVVDVTGNPTGLYAGATADVSIIVKQLNDVTEVPTGAISYGTNGQATVTQVTSGGAHVVKDVTVGAAENGETQITGGVSAGDKVLEKEITFKAPGGGARVASSEAPAARRGTGAASGASVAVAASSPAAAVPSPVGGNSGGARRMTLTPPRRDDRGDGDLAGDRSGAGDEGLPDRHHLGGCAARRQHLHRPG